MLRWLFLAGLGLLPGPAGAQCLGVNLYDALPAAEQAQLHEGLEKAPFARGNLWTAQKDGQSMTLVGTYHLGDPRHAATMQRLTPILEGASALLVEAGPEKEAALKARMAKEPALIVAKGPTLPERLAPEEWEGVKAAMAARGMPGFLAARFQPWYVAMMLGIPACAMQTMGARDGLDHQLIEAAQAKGLPVQALEPYDTLFAVFDSFTPEEQLDMLRSSLAMEADAEDMAVTMADLYFRGDSRLIWELARHMALDLPGYTPQRVAREFDLAEAALMNRRNRAWIDGIEAAAAKGPVLVAFGALHLSGREGVLQLLSERGWTLNQVEMP